MRALKKFTALFLTLGLLPRPCLAQGNARPVEPPGHVAAIGVSAVVPAISLAPLAVSDQVLPISPLPLEDVSDIRTVVPAEEISPRTVDLFAQKVQALEAGVQEAGKGLEKPGADGGHEAAGRQFEKLHGEQFVQADAQGPSAGFELLQSLREQSGLGFQERTSKEAKHYMFSVADNVVRNGVHGVVDAYTGAFIPGTGAFGWNYEESNRQRHDGWMGDDVLNEEHVWPESFFDRKEPMLSDLHHLMPVSSHVNEIRGNLPFGEVKGWPEYSNGGGAKLGAEGFEPPDAAKGRVARAMLYFYTRYGDHPILSSKRNQSFFQSRIEMFLLWNRAHPPTVEEKRRNDLVKEFQGNRNPYVDDPSLADRVGFEGFGGEKRFAGSRQAQPRAPPIAVAQPPAAARLAPASGAVFVVNDEGVNIFGRAAAYYQEVRRLVEWFKGKVDVSESLSVMDDAYGDTLAKISAIDAIAQGRGISRENTHLEKTLVWVDGVLDEGNKKIAVHTSRVFFHHAKNPKSEIEEGIRRTDAYIREAVRIFEQGGQADRKLGPLDEVKLVFDVRGYQEIKEHLMKRGAEVAKLTAGRIQFKFLDELAPMPRDTAAIRERLNILVKKYRGLALSNIIEGVIYSRYVGLLLELKTIEHYYKLGYKILQSGRELFDTNGMYISELDAVVQSPEGRVILVEAKSARVKLDLDAILRDKVLYKLETYRKFKAQLDAMIGKPFDAVVFAMDVGLDPQTPHSTALSKRNEKQKRKLIKFLVSKETSLSKEYGFPVSFLFLQSGPQVD